MGSALDRIARYLERMTRTLNKIEDQLEDQNKTLSKLASCVEKYPNGKTYLNISDD